jgi:excisionase family DNA binding protein
MFDATISGHRVRESGFATKKDAVDTLNELVAQARDQRHAQRVAEVASNEAVAEMIDRRLAALIAPLRAENEELQRENEKLRKAVEDTSFLSLEDAGARTGIPASHLRKAINEKVLPAAHIGRSLKVRASDLAAYANRVFEQGSVRDAIQNAYEKWGPIVQAAKRLAQRHRGGDWRERVRRFFPELRPSVIEMLDTEKPSKIVDEQVAWEILGRSGRTLRRRLSKGNKDNGLKG